MNVLLICDDFYHPGDVLTEGLAFLNISFDVVKDMNDFSTDTLKDYQLIIFSKSNHVTSKDRTHWLTPEDEDRFEEYVKLGGSMLVIHSGIADFKENHTFIKLIGAVFTHHPEQCQVEMKPILNNQITEGVKAFTEKDEHYFVDLKDEENITIFLNTVSSYGTQPGGWIKTLGRGKICVLTPGHNLSVFKNDQFKRLIKNSIEWLTGAFND